MNRTLHILSVISFAITVFLGVLSQLDPSFMPAKCAGYTLTLTVILKAVQMALLKIGDRADDGLLNGSFDPEKPVVKKDTTPPSALPLLALCSALLSLASCTAPQQDAAFKLTELGLQTAANRGVIKPGDALVIGQGVAVLTNPESDERDTVMRLADLGAKAAVSRGLLAPGDAVLILDGAAIVSRAVQADAEAVTLPKSSVK